MLYTEQLKYGLSPSPNRLVDRHMFLALRATPQISQTACATPWATTCRHFKPERESWHVNS